MVSAIGETANGDKIALYCRSNRPMVVERKGRVVKRAARQSGRKSRQRFVTIAPGVDRLITS